MQHNQASPTPKGPDANSTDQDLPLPAPPDLQGKLAFVIGGNNENSLDLILSLAEKGVDIVLVCMYSLQEKAAAVQRQIEQQGKQCLILTGDLTSPQFAQMITQKMATNWGKPHIFINYAVAKTNHQDNKRKTLNKSSILPNLTLMQAVLTQMID